MIAFQRRHYELIARTIRELNFGGVLDKQEIAREFANALQGTNPHFDRAKFIEACRPQTTYREKSR